MSRVLFWFVLSVFVIDASIGFTLTPPKNNIKPGKLFQYFDYGRSIESKLLRLVATKDEEAASIAKAGWFTPSNETEKISLQRTQDKRVFIYGMSFSNHVGKIISQQDKTLNVKIYSGPAASLNHSYTYYQHHGLIKKEML